jgi:hypothetical protein
LADAIDELAASPSRRRSMSEAARNRAHHEFAIDRMLENYTALYESMGEKIPDAVRA